MAESLIGRVLKSVFYRKSFSKATRLSKNSAGILSLLREVISKSSSLEKRGIIGHLSYKFTMLFNLLKAYAKGTYRDVPTRTVITIIAGFLYFLSPIDLIPDFIPLLGFTDDIALLTYIINTMGRELEKFEVWSLNNELQK